MADYGYFGKGAEGYAHYSQTFKSTFPNSNSGSCGSSHSTIYSSPSTAEKKDAEPQIPYDRKDYADPDLENATISVLFGVVILVIAVVVFIGIVISL